MGNIRYGWEAEFWLQQIYIDSYNDEEWMYITANDHNEISYNDCRRLGRDYYPAQLEMRIPPVRTIEEGIKEIRKTVDIAHDKFAQLTNQNLYYYRLITDAVGADGNQVGLHMHIDFESIRDIVTKIFEFRGIYRALYAYSVNSPMSGSAGILLSRRIASGRYCNFVDTLHTRDYDHNDAYHNDIIISATTSEHDSRKFKDDVTLEFRGFDTCPMPLMEALFHDFILISDFLIPALKKNKKLMPFPTLDGYNREIGSQGGNASVYYESKIYTVEELLHKWCEEYDLTIVSSDSAFRLLRAEAMLRNNYDASTSVLFSTEDVEVSLGEIVDEVAYDGMKFFVLNIPFAVSEGSSTDELEEITVEETEEDVADDDTSNEGTATLTYIHPIEWGVTEQ